MQPLIELRGINKIYNSGELAVQVLHDVSLEIHRGEFVAIIGSSGSGKSTLMNILGCLDRPSSGEYLFAGRKVSELDRDQLASLRREAFGFVFQSYNLIPSANAVENVEIPAIYARSEEHTSELQSRPHLVCRLLLEKKKKTQQTIKYNKNI